MKSTEKTRIIDKAVDFLRKAAVELEEFQVQASLGKSELDDIYEDAKKNFNQFIHDSKFKIKKGQEKFEDINASFDELMVQLALGKAESIDAFKEQKQKILLKLHEIEVKIKSNETLNKIYNYMLIDIEMFKVKLEILENNLDKSKENFKSSFEKGKQDFMSFIDKLKGDNAKKNETKWEHFQGEMTEALLHFKQAFSK